LLATISPKEGLQQVVVDHQGSAALLVDRCGRRIAELATNPWGLDVFDTAQNPERHRYTGHLRDINAPGRAWDDFDQMHARTYFPYAARFLSPDPGRDYDFSHPQSFNLYAYVRNNPITQSDPDGRKMALSNVTAEEAAALLEDLERITGLDLEWKDGVLTVAGDPTKAAGGSATARNDLLAAINAEETILSPLQKGWGWCA
jgi:RHS repeat-associated protein